MLTVNDLIGIAKQDLRIVSYEDDIARSSDLLCTARNRLIVLCNEQKNLIGVISRADILRGVYEQSLDFKSKCEFIASKNVEFCRVEDPLQSVWATMSEKNLNAMPVVDTENRVLGVLSAKCVLVKLLSEALKQDELMREYINGMGYR